MELLYLSHCVPSPPDRREKIRPHFELNELARRHKVHLACFARTPEELQHARSLIDRCASVYVAPLFPVPLHLARAGARFLAGASLNAALHTSPAMRADIAELMRTRDIRAAVACTAVMAPYVPGTLNFILDLAAVDSESWLQSAAERQPSFLYSLEARRLRRLEQAQASRAHLTLLSTRAEEAFFRSIAPEAKTASLENGVDFDFFDPSRVQPAPALSARRYLLFVGSLDHYPNQRAAIDFATRVFPALRARDPQLEFLVVGRKPSPQLFALARTAGVDVVGTVDDVRPYYLSAHAVVAPLLNAHGIPNKVLEALAMDKPVLASEAVCRAFGDRLPAGVQRCSHPEDYLTLPAPADIRRSARKRFSWKTNLEVLTDAVDNIARAARPR